ncbi:protein canopy homolog 3 [Nematolebias whitei]|uniref:protein canopy homolog 3 n=1 Tax=Nematolebias whitei TaxID=451745 RepID=UPI001899E1CE|nr:protein canopy homolog 3 [Nematolebias whitei]
MNLVVFLVIISSVGAAKPEGDDEWVHLPNRCEVCKFVSIEMKSAFEETGKTKAVIESNYNFIDGKGAPPVKYVKSIALKLGGLSFRAEMKPALRGGTGMSETFSTLHGLVNKGVKVVMDIPYELWNETSAEVADLKKQCDVMVERYEEVIEDWYKGNQEEDLTTYLCEKHVLKGGDTACLQEDWTAKKKGDPAAIAENTKKKKKKKKKKGEEGEEGGGSSDNEKVTKKKKKKEKKKKKGRSPVEKMDGGVTSDEEIQQQEPLSGQKMEL